MMKSNNFAAAYWLTLFVTIDSFDSMSIYFDYHFLTDINLKFSCSLINLYFMYPKKNDLIV